MSCSCLPGASSGMGSKALQCWRMKDGPAGSRSGLGEGEREDQQERGLWRWASGAPTGISACPGGLQAQGRVSASESW